MAVVPYLVHELVVKVRHIELLQTLDRFGDVTRVDVFFQ